ncbi:similar to Patched domain-containing protein 3 [Ectocarpus siliculosus]|uniref:Similar to Patched domain-containing protein 3, partial n=1 Tax=Ectocarpus siliculosus TaxID=2880 RepID=D8LCK9_ECTSI|nr:similar to Patched domain-containing protein 3 [Ectocarpus siliculosus]|eukprot:CBN79522.1 similar to Patched domain-containing protein 3 [Ectocarpus siliculosus]
MNDVRYWKVPTGLFIRGSAADVTLEDKRSWFVRTHAAANQAADERFYRLGYWVATHPTLTLLLNLVFVALCSIGFVNFTIVTDGSDYALLLLESAVEGGNVLTKASVDMLWDLNSRVMLVETESGNTYTDLCTTDADGVTCKQPFRGITRFWGNDFDIYEAAATSDADVLAAINMDTYPDGQAVSLEAVFGNSLTYDATGSSVVSAGVFMQSYELELTANDDEEFWEVRQWESLFHELVEGIMEEQEDGGGDDDVGAIFNLRYFTGRSIDDALAASVSGETFLFGITYTTMIVFITVILGKCGEGPVRRRSWLGVAGVGFIISAGVAAYGLNSAFGVPFTTLSQVLPFILVGIGVDDMIVIVSSFDHTDPALPVERRIADALKRCGVSITYTSMTNVAAFMLGSTTSLPAVTAFAACLAIDANRQKAGKMDWLCCLKAGARYTALQEDGVERMHGRPPEAREDQPRKSSQDAKAMQITPFGRFMREKYTPFILSTKGKALVLVGSACIFAAGVYGVTQATEGFDVIDLAPDTHHAQYYTDLAREYELEIDTQFIPLSVYTLEVDYPDVAVQAQIQGTDSLMVDQRFVVGPITSWLSGLLSWTANHTEYSTNVGTSGGYPVYEDRDTFYTALAEFTQDGDNSRFLSDFVYKTDGTIEISRTTMYLIDLTSTENGINALKDSREVVGESTLDPQPLAFSAYFVFSEQFLVIYDELMMNFVMALVAVAVFSVFILGRWKIIALVCFTLVIIDVELLGFVYHWRLDVNSLTVIELIMAVGLVVDYMVHIVHYFLHQDPDRDKDVRIADGLGEIGPSVVVGAATTFLGITPMAFAANHVFRVFFKMFLIIIGFGVRRRASPIQYPPRSGLEASAAI